MSRDRDNFSKNIEWLALNFKSRNELTCLIGGSPSFVSRAINRPESISIKAMEEIADRIGISNDVMFGSLDDFKKETLRWVKEKQKWLSSKRKTKRLKRIGKSSR